MTTSKYYHNVLAISLGSLLCLNLSVIPVLANSAHQSNNIPSQGLPGHRLGGGTRSPHLSDYAEQIPLVALIPETNLGVTTAAYPRFLFYLPTSNEVREIEYVLRNEADELVYETTFSVVSTAGIVSIDLADVEELDPLVMNKNYHWYFSIVAADRAQDIFVDGWTRRVELSTWIQEQTLAPDLAIRLNSAEPLEQARLLYQEAQLWHDAALILENLKQTYPDDKAIAAEWNSLLEAVNLPELSSTSIDRISSISATN